MASPKPKDFFRSALAHSVTPCSAQLIRSKCHTVESHLANTLFNQRTIKSVGPIGSVARQLPIGQVIRVTASYGHADSAQDHSAQPFRPRHSQDIKLLRSSSHVHDLIRIGLVMRERVNHFCISCRHGSPYVVACIAWYCEVEQEIGSGTTKRKRGSTCGKGARKIIKTSMKRLPLEFDFQTRRVISETGSAFMHGCGYIVRNNCSFQFKDWRLVPNEVKMPLRLKLTTLFDIDEANSNVCKVVDSYMARAWRAHRAKLHAHFKEIAGSKDPTKAKASPPYNISKEDWEYLCDMWCGATFLVKKLQKRRSRLVETTKWTAEMVRRAPYAITLRTGMTCILHQVKLTHGVLHIGMKNKAGYPEEAAATYEDMIKLRKQHSVESMSDKLILEKVLGRSSVRFHGWGRHPSICSNTTCTNQKLKHPTYDELVNEVETLKKTCAIMQQILVEKNLMSPLPEPSQDDTSESNENDLTAIEPRRLDRRTIPTMCIATDIQDAGLHFIGLGARIWQPTQIAVAHQQQQAPQDQAEGQIPDSESIPEEPVQSQVQEEQPLQDPP
ncbi:hypothetical protein R6Q59_012347 [Mikania micrantha]